MISLRSSTDINWPFQEVENVFFFFIVNQSQRFRGFARMKAPAKRNKEEIAWKLPDKMKAHGFSFGEVIKVSSNVCMQ